LDYLELGFCFDEKRLLKDIGELKKAVYHVVYRILDDPMQKRLDELFAFFNDESWLIKAYKSSEYKDER